MRQYGNVWREAQTMALAYGLDNARTIAGNMVKLWAPPAVALPGALPHPSAEENHAHWIAVDRDLHWIRVEFEYPPIPVRDHDWQAYTQDYDGAPDAGAQLTGHGRTEREALQSLFDCIADSEA